MKILLISSNKASLVMNCFPLGMAYIVSALKREGHRVEVIDFLDRDYPQKNIAEKIKAFSPALIGISIRNIDNQNMVNTETFYPEIKSLIKICRRNSKAPVVLGGAGYSLFPCKLLEYLEADYGIAGEGETSLCQLVKSLENEETPFHIPGLIKSGWKKPNLSEKINFEVVEIPEIKSFNLDKYREALMPVQG